MTTDINSNYVVKYALYDQKTNRLQRTFDGYIKLYDTAIQAREGRIKLHGELRKNGVKRFAVKVVKIRQTTEIIDILKS